MLWIMRHKMITLCPTTYEIAQKMPNFSEWVRNRLWESEDVPVEDPPLFHYQCPVCTKRVKVLVRIAQKCQYCNYPMKFVGVIE